MFNRISEVRGKPLTRLFRVLLISICVFFQFHTITVLADSTIDSNDNFGLYGESALLLDAQAGEVLYEKNGDEKKAIASTTKILTCLIALEEADQAEIVTVSENAAAQPDVQMNIAAGEKYVLGDLLRGMMLESYNDVSVAVAEHIAGSTDAFADLMNERAEIIGCENSYFITPNGLDAERDGKTNGSTAHDIALIMAEAIKNEEFLEITQTKQYTIQEVDDKRTVLAYNRNSFLDSYEGVLSGKTGFTGKAGYCYVGAVKRDNRTFIAVTLGSGWPPHKTYKWKDMNTLFNYAFDTFYYRKLDLSGVDIKESLPVKNGKISKYKETVCVDIEIPLDGTKRLLKESDSYYGKLNIPEELVAPVVKGESIGTLELYVNEELVETREVKSQIVWQKIIFGGISTRCCVIYLTNFAELLLK